METLLSRLGMILDSVQADVMQVNKGTKELSHAVEGIRQKSIAHDDSLHLLNRGQEEIKTSLDAGLRSISNQLNCSPQQEKMQEILSTVTNLLEQIEATVQDQTKELSKCFSEELKEIICSLKAFNQKHPPLALLPPKVTGGDFSSQKPLFKRESELAKMSKQGYLAPKVELGCWTTVEAEQGPLSNQYGNAYKNLKQRRISPLARLQKVVFNLDDESDEDLSWSIVENKLDNHLLEEVDEETKRILRKARMRKRKQRCKR